MAKLIMTRGLPGSGKSTWARSQKGFCVIEKDQIRKDLESVGWTWSQHGEKTVLANQAGRIIFMLKEGINVIAADTNFGSHEARLANIAKECGAEFSVRDFTDVPVEVCIQRNAGREKPVPEKAIWDMYTKYVEPFQKIEKVEWIDGMPTAVICDLDGTLCLHVDRGPYEEEKCETDEINPAVKAVLYAMKVTGHQLIFLSGRKDKVRVQTQNWLDKHGWGGYPLLMRRTDDNRNDAIVKQEIFDQNIRGKWNVTFVLDDRDRVVKRWRELGLACFQVNYGAF